MKHYKNIFKLLIAGLLLSSCNLLEVNEDVNTPTEVPVNLLLPTAQQGMANSMMNENSATVGIFLQYFTAKNVTQYAPYNNYVVDNGFYIDDMWQDYYASTMITTKSLMDEASNSGAYHYLGIAQIMMAWTLGTVTDCWGDVPYTEAFQGSLNLKPGFDSQKEIYNNIFTLLEQGIANLDKESSRTPGTDDIIFNGDLAMWKKAGYSLIARNAIHLTKVASELTFDPSNRAIEASANGLTPTDVAMSYTYGFDASDVSPYTAGKNDNDLVINNTFKNMIATHPSKNALTKTQLGSADAGPYLKGTIGFDNVKCYFITPWEASFIEAEARLRNNESDAAVESAFKNAVESFLLEAANYDTQLTTDSIAGYVSRLSLTGTYDQKLETIINHKYISLLGQVEAWSDYRRTGYPQLIPNPEGTSPQNPNGLIPRRYPYSQSEMENNGANVPSSGINMQVRVWWDAE